MKKRILKIILSVCGFVVLWFGIQRLVMPKYMTDILEGSFTEEYYKETTKHDVIFVGDCEVYENFSPITLWKEYGITSYIRGNAQQLIWQSYYMLEDTLKYEKPKVVVYNVQSLMHSEPQKEEYNRMTLDGMRWSSTKIKAINASMLENESFYDYLFPILRYHSRITNLNKSDIQYYFSKRQVTHNGYYMRVDTTKDNLDVDDASENDGEDDLGRTEEKSADDFMSFDDFDDVEEYTGEDTVEEDNTDAGDPKYKFGDYPMEYLNKLRELCNQEGITLILVKAPSSEPVWYNAYEQQVEAYAEKYQLTYINYLEKMEEIGIDYQNDSYDGGLHMNLNGAEKLATDLGKILSKDFQIKDHRGEKEYDDIYSKKAEFYDKMIADQKEELKKYGKIINY